MSGLRGVIQDRIKSLSLSRLVASPRGRAFLLAFMADAEDSDENAVLDTLVARVEDGRLQKMVRRHRDDEVRHARVLREASARAFSGPIPQVPRELRIILRVDEHLGGFAAKFAAGAAGVMETYLNLQVIEERAVRDFPAIVRALEGVDAEAARVVEGVLRDETRHVQYAKAVSRVYEPDDATREEALARFRAAEARAFAEHQRLFLRFVLRNDLLDVRGPERLLWRALAA